MSRFRLSASELNALDVLMDDYVPENHEHIRQHHKHLDDEEPIKQKLKTKTKKWIRPDDEVLLSE